MRLTLSTALISSKQEFYAYIFFWGLDYYINSNYFVRHLEACIPNCFEVSPKDPEIRHISKIRFTTFIFVGRFKEVERTRLL